MSTPAPSSASSPARTEKPRSNVYTMMLILSFFAIATACAMLWLELSTYGDYPWWKVPADVSSQAG